MILEAYAFLINILYIILIVPFENNDAYHSKRFYIEKLSNRYNINLIMYLCINYIKNICQVFYRNFELQFFKIRHIIYAYRLHLGHTRNILIYKAFYRRSRQRSRIVYHISCTEIVYRLDNVTLGLRPVREYLYII